MFENYSNNALFAFWFILGALVMGALQVGQARATGGLTGLIGAGASHSIRPVVEAELHNPSLQSGIGHDGQLFFAVALDPVGEFVPSFMEPHESPAYRYRRIGYPALAGLFGTIGGMGLVWSMAALNLAAVGTAAGAVALIARQTGASPWLALSIALNPGVWLSGRLLTADNVALAAGLLAILMVVRGRSWLSIIPLSLATLTKEVAVAFALGLAIYLWHTRSAATAASILIVSSLPLLAWMGYVHLSIGSVLDTAGNLTWPGGGILEAIPTWASQRPRDNLWIAVILGIVVLGMVKIRRFGALWVSLTLPWLAIALSSSHLVWDVGNNAVRTLAPLIPLVAMGLSQRPSRVSAASL